MKPSYQMSNGSSLRPSRFAISAATRGTSGDDITCVSSERTRSSGISSSSWKWRSISVRAIGESASALREALKSASRMPKRVSGSRSLEARGCAARLPCRAICSISISPGGLGVTALVAGFQSRRGSSITACGICWVTIRSIASRISRCRCRAAALSGAA